MKYCTEKSRQWPDASADVSPGEMDDFLAHAEVCPYHAEILRAEDNEFSSVFRSARGLDAAGRILRGAELQNAIAEHERLKREWEKFGKDESPFGLISLYNGGRLIACCGEFLDFTDHQALHELDPRPGLQIRARCSSDDDEEVLLGFYALSGVRHDSEERLFPLDNGYTIGLRVEKFRDRNFRVGFRCVEHSVIENEKASGGAQPKVQVKGAGAGGSIFNFSSASNYASSRYGSQWAHMLLPPAGNWQTGVISVALALVVLLTFSGYLVAGSNQFNAENTSTQDLAGTVPRPVEGLPDSGGVLGAGNGLPNEPDPPTPMGVVPSSKGSPRKVTGTANASLRTTARASKVEPDQSAKSSNDLLLNGLPPNTRQVLTAEKKEDNPQVSIKRLWGGVIRAADREVGVIDVRHYGKDPVLLDQVRKVLRARANLTELRWPCEGVKGAESSDFMTDYETSWALIPSPEPNGRQSRLIAVELRALSGDSHYRMLYGGVFPVRGQGTELDYEATISKAVDEIYDQLDDWLKQSEVTTVTETVSDPMLNQSPPNAVQGGASVIPALGVTDERAQ